MLFLLLYNAADLAHPFRAVGCVTLGEAWKFDISFRTEQEALNQLLRWFAQTKNPQFYDLTR